MHLFAGGISKVISREILERGDAVAVLPYDPVSDTILLVEQVRIGAIKSKAFALAARVYSGYDRWQ